MGLILDSSVLIASERRGETVKLEDLVIGATALHLGFEVATLNRTHFQLIPDLKIVTL